MTRLTSCEQSTLSWTRSFLPQFARKACTRTARPLALLQVKRLKEERQELDLALKKERRAALSAKARPLPTAALVIACAACRTHLVDALTLGAVSCLCACSGAAGDDRQRHRSDDVRKRAGEQCVRASRKSARRVGAIPAALTLRIGAADDCRATQCNAVPYDSRRQRTEGR